METNLDYILNIGITILGSKVNVIEGTYMV